MATRDVITLNEASSSIEVPQAGDTYNLPRSTSVTGDLAVSGNLTGNLQGLAGRIDDPLVKLPLRRPEEITGTTAAAGAQYSGAPAFTRASTATYVDALDGLVKTDAINTPRFEKMADGGIGCLLEGASTNLLTYSEQYNNVAWGYGQGVARPSGANINATTAPDGTLTADAIVDTGAVLANHFAPSQSVALQALTYTYSIYVKRVQGATIYPAFMGAGIGAASEKTVYNLETETVNLGTTNTLVQSAGMQNVGHGWYRLWCVFTPPTGTYSIGFGFNANATDNTNTGHVYTGVAGDGFYFWGAQLEAIPFASSYIPTTTAAVMRAADVTSLALAGNTQGAATPFLAFGEVDFIGKNSVYEYIFQQQTGVNGGTHLVYRNPTTDILRSQLVTSLGSNAALSNGVSKFGYGWDGINHVLYHNGVKVGFAIDSNANTPKGTINLFVGAYGHIRNFRIYDRALTDTEVAAL